MNVRPSWADLLIQQTVELRNKNRTPRAGLISIATQMGVEVWLLGGTDKSNAPVGMLTYSTPPKITLTRTSGVEFRRKLSESDEALLSIRERFTTAHEIGHWLAYKGYGVTPKIGRSEYWQDEQIVNEFAGRLLVPDWQLDAWLRTYPSGMDIYINRLFEWARDCAVSVEVLSQRICASRPDVGFLKLIVQTPRRQHFPDLKVIHCAKGDQIDLPNIHSIIRNERVASILVSKRNGEKHFRSVRLTAAQKKAADLYCSWALQHDRRNREALAGESKLHAMLWTSWGRHGFLSSDPLQSNIA